MIWKGEDETDGGKIEIVNNDVRIYDAKTTYVLRAG